MRPGSACSVAPCRHWARVSPIMSSWMRALPPTPSSTSATNSACLWWRALKENLPELSAAVEKRFCAQRPHRVLKDAKTRIEIWDADDFDPWETLQWETVRVLRYRQHKPDGTVVQADWFTNFSKPKVVSWLYTAWPRAGGKLRTKASTTASPIKGWNISAITTPTACSFAGC